MSSYKAGFNPRENEPLSRNTLHTLLESTRQRTNPAALRYPMGFRDWSLGHTNPKVGAGHLIYPVSVRDTAKSRIGCRDNCHLNYLVKFIIVNVGGLHRDAKASSPPMPVVSVGAAIVVRGWESQPLGEGPQSAGIFRAEVTEC